MKTHLLSQFDRSARWLLFATLVMVLVSVSSVTLATPKKGGTLTIVPDQTMGFERDFNPFSSSIGTQYAQDFIYERLYFRNSLNPEVEYFRLADRYELGADLKSVTFTLRDNAKWSDGKKLTADDVVFTVDYLRQHPRFNSNIISLYDPNTGQGDVRSVTKLSSRKIRFDLNSANSLAAQRVGRLIVLPKHVFSKVEDPLNFRNPDPIGSGPFTEITKFNTMFFKLCRNPHYWDDAKPYLDCLRFPLLNDNTHLWAQARRGKIHWMSQGISNPDEDFANHQHHNKYFFGPGYNVVFSMNTRKAPFNQLAFRQALSLALDRTTMLTKDTFGLTQPAYHPVAVGALYENWFNPEQLKPYDYLMQYQPKQAQSLLDQAGYIDKDGDGWRDNPNGSAINIQISVPSGWTDWVNTCRRAVTNFAAIGVRAHLHTPNADEWRSRVPSGDIDMYIQVTGLHPDPVTPFSEMFDPNAMTPGQVTFGTLHQYSLPEVNRWIDKFYVTVELAEQKRIMNEIYGLVAEHLPVITLFSNPDWYEYNDEKFGGFVSADNHYIRPVIWSNNPERLIHALNIYKK